MEYSDRELLARTLQAEAGNQGRAGMLAAGSVIMNRARTPGYGDGVRGVIMRPGQFSAWNSVTGYAGGEQGQDMTAMTPSGDAYSAADALIGGQYSDPTGGATHYYNPAISQPTWGMGAGGDWTRIGDHVFGSADAGRGSARVSTRGAPTGGILSEGNQMAQPQQGLLSSLGIQRRDPNAQGETAQPFYNRRSFGDTMARIAPALGRMGVMGLEGPAQAALDSRNERQGDERARAAQEQQRNQTREWFANQPNGDDWVAMFDAVGAGPTMQAMQAANAQPDQPSAVQNYEYLLAQGVDPETATALAFGSGGVTVNTGGPATSVGWEAIDKAYADTWLHDSVSGLPDAASQAAQISGVLGQLESGQELTGPAIGVQGDFIRAIINPGAQDAKDRVEQVVQRSLRETLGSQFTATEGDRLIARAYNINLPPEINAARLRALFLQLEAVAGQRLAMRNHFNTEGTLQGFDGNSSIPTIDDFIATMDAAAPAPAPEGGGADISAMSTEELQAIVDSGQ